MKIKYFSENKVILTDGQGAFEYVLETKNDTEKFDRDLLEDILDWEPNRMNIIIEGIDGSGKTTLANKLVENYHLNNNIHLTAKTENDFKFHMGLLINNQKTVFDRFHFSEFNVFSPLYGRKTKLTHEEWDLINKQIIENNDLFIVMVCSDMSIVDARLVERGELDYIPEVRQQNELFLKACDEFENLYHYKNFYVCDIAVENAYGKLDAWIKEHYKNN